MRRPRPHLERSTAEKFEYSTCNSSHICELQLGWHPVSVVQYTFTHKQYIEQYNETEYTEQNIYNNKNT